MSLENQNIWPEGSLHNSGSRQPVNLHTKSDWLIGTVVFLLITGIAGCQIHDSYADSFCSLWDSSSMFTQTPSYWVLKVVKCILKIIWHPQQRKRNVTNVVTVHQARIRSRRRRRDFLRREALTKSHTEVYSNMYPVPIIVSEHLLSICRFLFHKNDIVRCKIGVLFDVPCNRSYEHRPFSPSRSQHFSSHYCPFYFIELLLLIFVRASFFHNES